MWQVAEQNLDSCIRYKKFTSESRGEDIKDKVNNIKKRQSLDLFAPMILEEHFMDNFVCYKK